MNGFNDDYYYDDDDGEKIKWSTNNGCLWIEKSKLKVTK